MRLQKEAAAKVALKGKSLDDCYQSDSCFQKKILKLFTRLLDKTRTWYKVRYFMSTFRNVSKVLMSVTVTHLMNQYVSIWVKLMNRRKITERVDD